jgi:hypothetical protein
MAAFFAIFYVDDAYLAARDPDFLQVALNSLVSLFERVGLETNVKKNASYDLHSRPNLHPTLDRLLPPQAWLRDSNERTVGCKEGQVQVMPADNECQLPQPPFGGHP